MVSAAVAAFFYLRVAVTMFSPVGAVGDLVDGADGAVGGGMGADGAGDGGMAHDGAGDGPGGPASGGAGAPVSSLLVLTDAPPLESVTERGPVAVPTLTWLAIGLSVGFTVVFGIIPGPILDFAHQATLLFP
jgi:hypothetical protein